MSECAERVGARSGSVAPPRWRDAVFNRVAIPSSPVAILAGVREVASCHLGQGLSPNPGCARAYSETPGIGDGEVLPGVQARWCTVAPRGSERRTVQCCKVSRTPGSR